MAYQPIDLGIRGNPNTGDDINIGGSKINDNFSELYSTKLDSIIAGSNVSIDNTNPTSPIINVTSTGVEEVVISTSTNINSTFNNKLVVINNSTNDITLTVDSWSNLGTGFKCYFIQLGTGIVTFSGFLLSLRGNIMFGQYSNAAIFRLGLTNNIILSGELTSI